HLFGKVKIVEPLGDSPSAAKDEARFRVVRYRDVFKQVEAGLLTTPQQVADAMRPGEPDIALEPGFDAAMRRYLADPAARRAEFERRRRERFEQITARFEAYGSGTGECAHLFGDAPAATARAGETITQAAEAWYDELTRDETAAPRGTTLDGHRLRVRAFVDTAGDVALTEVTRAMASDFLAGLKVKNRTRNAYATTLK